MKNDLIHVLVLGIVLLGCNSGKAQNLSPDGTPPAGSIDGPMQSSRSKRCETGETFRLSPHIVPLGQITSGRPVIRPLTPPGAKLP